MDQLSHYLGKREPVGHGDYLTEVLRHSSVYTVVCITVALHPCRLVDSALGEVAVPAGVEIVLIGALPALSVAGGFYPGVTHRSLRTYYELALDIPNAAVQI